MIGSLFFLWLSHILVDFCVGIWPLYKTIKGIDILYAGVIAGASGFIGEAMQLYFGYIADRGWRKFIMILGILLASSVLFLPIVDSLIGCFFCVFLLMVGSGAFHPSALGIASILAPVRKGKTILFFASGGALGLAMSQLIFHKVQNLPFALWLLPSITIILLLFFLRFPKGNASRANLDLKNFLAPFAQKKRPLLLLYFAQIANQALFLSFVFLLPDLMREQGCHDWLCQGGGHLCAILGGALAMVPAGALSDRYGHRPVMIILVAISIVALYSLLFFHPTGVLVTSFLLMLIGASVGAINPLIIAWGNTLVPESPSFVSAILGGFAWCFGHLGTIVVGLLAGSAIAMACVSSLAIMGLLLIMNFLFLYSMPVTKPVTQPNVEKG